MGGTMSFEQRNKKKLTTKAGGTPSVPVEQLNFIKEDRLLFEEHKPFRFIENDTSIDTENKSMIANEIYAARYQAERQDLVKKKGSILQSLKQKLRRRAKRHTLIDERKRFGSRGSWRDAPITHETAATSAYESTIISDFKKVFFEMSKDYNNLKKLSFDDDNKILEQFEQYIELETELLKQAKKVNDSEELLNLENNIIKIKKDKALYYEMHQQYLLLLRSIDRKESLYNMWWQKRDPGETENKPLLQQIAEAGLQNSPGVLAKIPVFGIFLSVTATACNLFRNTVRDLFHSFGNLVAGTRARNSVGRIVAIVGGTLLSAALTSGAIVLLGGSIPIIGAFLASTAGIYAGTLLGTVLGGALFNRLFQKAAKSIPFFKAELSYQMEYAHLRKMRQIYGLDEGIVLKIHAYLSNQAEGLPEPANKEVENLKELAIEQGRALSMEKLCIYFIGQEKVLRRQIYELDMEEVTNQAAIADALRDIRMPQSDSNTSKTLIQALLSHEKKALEIANKRFEFMRERDGIVEILQEFKEPSCVYDEKRFNFIYQSIRQTKLEGIVDVPHDDPIDALFESVQSNEKRGYSHKARDVRALQNYGFKDIRLAEQDEKKRALFRETMRAVAPAGLFNHLKYLKEAENSICQQRVISKLLEKKDHEIVNMTSSDAIELSQNINSLIAELAQQKLKDPSLINDFDQQIKELSRLRFYLDFISMKNVYRREDLVAHHESSMHALFPYTTDGKVAHLLNEAGSLVAVDTNKLTEALKRCSVVNANKTEPEKRLALSDLQQKYIESAFSRETKTCYVGAEEHGKTNVLPRPAKPTCKKQLLLSKKTNDKPSMSDEKNIIPSDEMSLEGPSTEESNEGYVTSKQPHSQHCHKYFSELHSVLHKITVH